MSGKAIGKTLDFGYRGAVSRTPDTLIQAYQNVGDDNIQFGEPVVFDATTGGVRKIKSTDTTNNNIIGIAVRRMGDPYTDNAFGWYYKKGDTVDVIVRGSVIVELKDTTSIAAHGGVYVGNGAGTPAAGDLYCASGTGLVQVPNAIFTTGSFDGNKCAEVTITERKA